MPRAPPAHVLRYAVRDTVHYRDAENPTIIHSMYIEDHGSSALKGVFYLVQRHGERIKKISNEIMDDWTSGVES